MRYSDYNEIKQRGTFNFPIEFHYVDSMHPRYMMSYHWHIQYEIIRILKGELIMQLDQKSIKAGEGDFVFIRDGILHAGDPKECIYECIVFDINMLLKENYSGTRYIQDIIDHTILINDYFSSENLELNNTLNKLFTSLEAKQTGYELVTLGALYELLGEIYDNKLYSTDYLQTEKDSKKILQLKKVLKVIENTYASPLTLEDLSKVIGMSRKYFCKFFFEMTNRTPIDYVNYYRIECASLQLLTTNLSITEIAYNCGFNDLSYFIKAFKKYKGITPSKYSKQKRMDFEYN